jgi:hypothetical protein
MQKRNFFFFFFLLQNFKQKAPLSRFLRKAGNRYATGNVLSLGRPKQNAQPGMFDGNPLSLDRVIFFKY